MTTGAQSIARSFRNAGVERVYLYPGGTIVPTLNAWIEIGGEYVVARHEQGAGYAALAAARLSGRPQVVMVTSGPGVTNVMTVIADAWYDSTPLVVVTGQVGTSDLKGRPGVRQRGFQEVPTADLVGSITRACLRPMSPDDLPGCIPEAFRLASQGRPGPVVVDLPMDVQRGELATAHAPAKARAPEVRLPEDAEIDELAQRLADSVRPVILAGQGVHLSRARGELRQLAERLQVPVATSLPGVGAFPGGHPLSLGFIGHTGCGWANRAVHEADLLLALGARLDVRQTGTQTAEFVPHGDVVRVDIDSAELANGRVHAAQTLCADVRQVLEAVAARSIDVPKDEREAWLRRIADWRNAMPLDAYPAGAGCHPATLLGTLDRLLGGRELVVVTGVGHHQQWTARHMQFDAPRRSLLTSGGHGAMGYDLPSAVGAAFERPDATVLCVVGDGSFQINQQELATIASYDLAVKVLVLDNRRLAMVSQFQNITFGCDPSTGDRDAFPFAGYAELLGIPAFRLERDEAGSDTLRRFLATAGPALLEARIDPACDVSPMLLGGQAMNDMWIASS